MPCLGGVGNQVRIIPQLCAPVPMRVASGLVLNAMPSPLDAQSFVEKPLQKGIEAFAKVPIRHMGVFGARPLPFPKLWPVDPRGGAYGGRPNDCLQ